jgi:hypothetical protein
MNKSTQNVGIKPYYVTDSNGFLLTESEKRSIRVRPRNIFN